MESLSSTVDAEGRLALDKVRDRVPEVLVRAYEAVAAGRKVVSQGRGSDLEQALGQDSLDSVVSYMAARVLMGLGRTTEAEAAYRRILGHESHPAVLHRMAQICAENPSRSTEAMEFSGKAHELVPDHAWMCGFYGRDLIYAGRVEKGIEYLDLAAKLGPDDPCLQLNPLWFRHYVPGYDRAYFYDAYRAWGRRFSPTHLTVGSHRNSPDRDRRLRIGYISPDFRAHSVAYAFEPLLDGHDRSQVEVFGYGNVPSPDGMTARLAVKFDTYRDIRDQSPKQVAIQVLADRIDVLVALAGHCTGNRLGVLAYRPAPIQVDIGSISTIGMPQVDYRITDAILDPPESQAVYEERLVHMPDGFVSFRPPKESPLVEPAPALRNGFVTFGSFNNHIKINDYTISLWSKVLDAVPGSRMILKFQAGHDAGLREYYLARFDAHGVRRDRVSIAGGASLFEHLRLLGQVDMALDTFPFNGCITTLEGLWMGVPIITLTGTTYVAQVGRDILTHLGLEPFVANSSQEYVAKAAAFAVQQKELACIRQGLRGLMLASPICDPARFTRHLEAAFRGMWVSWCEGQIKNQKSRIKDKESIVPYPLQHEVGG